MKRQLTLTLLMIAGLAVFAAPLKNIEVRLTQPDGQVINCFASGDEFYNYLHDANGFTIVQGEGGYYCYAVKDQAGKVVASPYVVGTIDPVTVGLQPYVKISQKEYYSRRHEREQYIHKPERKNGKELNHGLYNNLVVFIRFAGDTYHTTPFSIVEEMFNGADYESNSLHNYYHHTSYNQLDLWSHFFPQPDGETLLSYEDIHPKQYYQPYDPVTNPIGYQDGQTAEREFSLLERAINYIEDMVPDDLNLDYNEDGKVDNVVFVIKGEPGEWASLLWPHRWCIYDRYVPLHDLQVYDFNLQLEQGGMFNVSTLCHEMFHSLGAPDLYHYSEGVDPVGSWDLMCGTTEPPQQTSTYMKYKYGNWVDEIPVINPEDLDTWGTYELESVAWEGGRHNGYMIPTGYPDQFFFVEYRNKHNFFEREIPGSGLLIYRIDTRFDGNAGWNGSNVFDEVYLFRPNGTATEVGDLNLAFFSEESGRTSFNYATNPSPFINQQPYSFFDWAFQITDISKIGDRMSFDIRPYYGEGGYHGPDDFTVHVNSLEHQLYFSWNSDPYADYYKVYCDGSGISTGITDTTFVYPYTEDDNGYHVYSVLSVTGGMLYLHSAPTYNWAILGNYETIDLAITCDSPYGTKGGELEVTFDNPAMKSQSFTIYQGFTKEAELHVPANTSVSFIWHPGFDSDSQGIHVEATHRNANGQGSIFSINNPASGTLAVYTTSDNGLGFIAPQNLTATTSGTDVLLHWTIAAENNRFAIYRDGIKRPTEAVGYEYMDNTMMRSGAHGYLVENTEGSFISWHPENTVYATVFNYYCEPPRNLQGTHYASYNELQWEEPQLVGTGMLAYDNNKFDTLIGSANQKWGIKFEPEQLALFEGQPLISLEMFDCTAATYTFKFYNGDKASSSNLIFTQHHEMTGSGEWVRFPLDEHVSYDISQPLWISVQSTGGNNPVPCCAYTHVDNGCLIPSGNTWKPITDFDIYYTWMLRAYTEPATVPHDFTYNLYWGEEECNDEQMMLGLENISANSVVHNTGNNIRYQVTAIWDGRETDLSNPVFLGPSVEIEEDLVSISNNSFAFINGGEIIINDIDDNAKLQVIDLVGRIVVSRIAAQRVSTTEMAPGIYVLRLISDNNVKTQKIVIR